mgnify:CR=1 FL=1
MPELSDEYIRLHVTNALAEDIGSGDVTTNALISADHQSEARIIAREDIVLSGISLALAVFQELDPHCEIHQIKKDGHQVNQGDNVMSITASTRALLTGERTALNFIQRMSGIATIAALYVNEVRDSNALIFDTRKTTPGWRLLEKYAAQCGGAQNHRYGLDDMVMIKDNHLASMGGSNRIARAIETTQKHAPELKVEVEADTVSQAKQAADAGADIVLLDNMTLGELRRAVSAVDNRSQTEASGGISLRDIKEIASTGVNRISVGAITHSAPAVDISMEIKN